MRRRSVERAGAHATCLLVEAFERGRDLAGYQTDLRKGQIRTHVVVNDVSAIWDIDAHSDGHKALLAVTERPLCAYPNATVATGSCNQYPLNIKLIVPTDAVHPLLSIFCQSLGVSPHIRVPF